MQSRVSALSRRSSQEQSLGSDEDDARAIIILRDTTSQNYILLAIEHYTTALRLSPNHVYQALPRLLSIWFDFTAIRHDKSASAGKTDDGKAGGDTTSGPSGESFDQSSM
jgi:hypothetical protein